MFAPVPPRAARPARRGLTRPRHDLARERRVPLGIVRPLPLAYLARPLALRERDDRPSGVIEDLEDVRRRTARVAVVCVRTALVQDRAEGALVVVTRAGRVLRRRRGQARERGDEVVALLRSEVGAVVE